MTEESWKSLENPQSFELCPAMSNVSASRLIRPYDGRFDALVHLPSSKSIALRQLVISALSTEPTVLHGLDISDDVTTMVNCLEALGVSFTWKGNNCVVDPKGFNWSDAVELDVRMSGLTLRLLIAIAALRTSDSHFFGHESLGRRPNKDLLEAIRQLSCNVESANGLLPISIRGKACAGQVRLKADVSSQFLTALLLCGPRFPKGIEIHLTGSLVSSSYVEITLEEMRKRGVNVERIETGYRVSPQDYEGCEVSIEGDASAATYFSALATLHSSRVTFSNLGTDTRQGDRLFFDICNRLGAQVTKTNDTTVVEGGDQLLDIDQVDMIDMPDAALTMMAISPYLKTPTRITGLQSLPFKECNRIACPAQELRRANVDVEEGSDYVVIHPGRPTPTEFKTYDDHRMAMSFAVLSTKTAGCSISNPECVNKTYPRFWRDLDGLWDS